MSAGPPSVLTLNGGSSSIRFSVQTASEPPVLLCSGMIDRIGRQGTGLLVRYPGRPAPSRVALPRTGYAAAADSLLAWLKEQPFFGSIQAVGHRVVHGLRRTRPARITPRLLAELHRLTAYDPEHLPNEIGLIQACRRRHPRLPQVACFDTAFHHTMPRVARLLPLPRRYASMGVERYGFHGLSYEYLLEELGRLDPAARSGRLILAHLGNGASLAAVHHGRCLDTSMGFTPASGLVMGTRSGDLDPGLFSFLARRTGMTPSQFNRLVNHESGLLGVSGTGSDMHALLAREARDVRAAEAVALFCQQARKWIGSFAAVLGGLDTLVFAGGIGENAPLIRERICAGLGFLGVRLHRARNGRNAPLISTDASRVRVRVIPTNEELMIARATCRVLHL